MWRVQWSRVAATMTRIASTSDVGVSMLSPTGAARSSMKAYCAGVYPRSWPMGSSMSWHASVSRPVSVPVGAAVTVTVDFGAGGGAGLHPARDGAARPTATMSATGEFTNARGGFINMLGLLTIPGDRGGIFPELGHGRIPALRRSSAAEYIARVGFHPKSSRQVDRERGL